MTNNQCLKNDPIVSPTAKERAAITAKITISTLLCREPFVTYMLLPIVGRSYDKGSGSPLTGTSLDSYQCTLLICRSALLAGRLIFSCRAYSSFLKRNSRSSLSFGSLARLVDDSLNFSKLFCLRECLSEPSLLSERLSFSTSASKDSFIGSRCSSYCLEI